MMTRTRCMDKKEMKKRIFRKILFGNYTKKNVIIRRFSCSYNDILNKEDIPVTESELELINNFKFSEINIRYTKASFESFIHYNESKDQVVHLNILDDNKLLLRSFCLSVGKTKKNNKSLEITEEINIDDKNEKLYFIILYPLSFNCPIVRVYNENNMDNVNLLDIEEKEPYILNTSFSKISLSTGEEDNPVKMKMATIKETCEKYWITCSYSKFKAIYNNKGQINSFKNTATGVSMKSRVINNELCREIFIHGVLVARFINDRFIEVNPKDKKVSTTCTDINGKTIEQKTTNSFYGENICIQSHSFYGKEIEEFSEAVSILYKDREIIKYVICKNFKNNGSIETEYSDISGIYFKMQKINDVIDISTNDYTMKGLKIDNITPKYFDSPYLFKNMDQLYFFNKYGIPYLFNKKFNDYNL